MSRSRIVWTIHQKMINRDLVMATKAVEFAGSAPMAGEQVAIDTDGQITVAVARRYWSNEGSLSVVLKHVIKNPDPEAEPHIGPELGQFVAWREDHGDLFTFLHQAGWTVR